MKFLTFFLVFCAVGCPCIAQKIVVDTTDGSYELYDESYALVIGVSEYDAHPSWENLAVVSEEVEEVSDALIRQGFEVTEVLNPNYAELDLKLRQFFSRQYGTKARLIVFFAGHGWTDYNRAGFIVPRDGRVVDHNDPLFKISYMSFETIEAHASQTNAKHVLFVFDSCFSGWAMRSESGYIPDKAFIRDIDRPTRQFITSGTADEQVPDDPLFYKEFIRGISGAANTYFDNVVTVDELAYWLRLRVVRQGQQTPQYGRSRKLKSSAGDMVFTNLPLAPEPIKQFGTGEIVDLDVPAPNLQQKIVLEPAGTVEPRQSNLRSLGTPSNKLYEGLEVIYYGKLEDGTRVVNALQKENVPYVLKGSQISDDIGVNAVACGSDVELPALKHLLMTLIKAGTPIRNVIRFRDQKEKSSRMEILTLIEKFDKGLTVRSPVMTLEDVSNLDECPANFREVTNTAMGVPSSEVIHDQFEIEECAANKLDGQITREFSQSASVRCPGGGCMFWESGNCNRRETTLNFVAPSGYAIDTYKFAQGSTNAGTTGTLKLVKDTQSLVQEISVELVCDPSNYPGAGGGWNEGTLTGTVRYLDIEELQARAEQECQIELAQQ